MGKKYTTSAQTVRSISTEEVPFLVEAWEGIKPSRKSAITVRVARETERPANWRPKTDKVGRRPRSVTVRGDLAPVWRTLSVTCADQHTYTLSTDGVEWELLRTRPGYAPKSEVFTNISDIKFMLDQYEFGYWASAQHENLAKRVLGDLLVTE